MPSHGADARLPLWRRPQPGSSALGPRCRTRRRPVSGDVCAGTLVRRDACCTGSSSVAPWSSRCRRRRCRKGRSRYLESRSGAVVGLRHHIKYKTSSVSIAAPMMNFGAAGIGTGEMNPPSRPRRPASESPRAAVESPVRRRPLALRVAATSWIHKPRASTSPRHRRGRLPAARALREADESPSDTLMPAWKRPHR